jgi:uncharacterized protein
MELPSFKYHPDPLATGSIVKRQARCDCCGEVRDFIYDGLPYNEELEGDVTICPWCISDGRAHEKLGLEFNDPGAVGGYDWALRKTVPTEIKEEVAYRTPGFCSWQQEKWLVHCNDACVFLGPSGRQEIEAIGSQELIDSLQEDIQMDEEEFERYFNALDKKRPPTAYVFRCLRCGVYLGFSDFD